MKFVYEQVKTIIGRISFRDLKKFCNKYDEQVKKLCEDTHVTIMEEY